MKVRRQDRDGFTLMKEQEALIQAVAKVNPRTIVIINSGNPVGMGQWIEKVPSGNLRLVPGPRGRQRRGGCSFWKLQSLGTPASDHAQTMGKTHRLMALIQK